MKHKVTVTVKEEKKGIFTRRTVQKKKTVTLDQKTYRKMQREKKIHPFTMDEMMIFDEILDDD